MRDVKGMILEREVNNENRKVKWMGPTYVDAL